MKEVNLKLTLEETNVILSALGNLPYIQVQSLIPKIQAQAEQQLNGSHQETSAKAITKK